MKLILPRDTTKAPTGPHFPEPGEPHCELCRFWKEGDGQKQTNPDGSPAVRFGICRRFPPTMAHKMLLRPTGQPLVGPDMQIQVTPFPLWPVLGNIEWCGEYSPELGEGHGGGENFRRP